MFVDMLALLSYQVSRVHGETYWTYVPGPPLVHPAVWTENQFQYILMMHTYGRFFRLTYFLNTNGFNYTGYSGSLTICWSHDKNAVCLKLALVKKTAYGGAKEANITGPWDLKCVSIYKNATPQRHNHVSHRAFTNTILP